MTTDSKKPGVAFWATVVLGAFGLVSLIVAITVVGLVIWGLIVNDTEMSFPVDPNRPPFP